MRLLLLIAAVVAVVFFLTRKSAAGTTINPDGSPDHYDYPDTPEAPTPGELADAQNAETDASSVASYNQPTFVINLPGGISVPYFGDLSVPIDITDPNGLPYPIAPARPN